MADFIRIPRKNQNATCSLKNRTHRQIPRAQLYRMATVESFNANTA